MIIDQKKQDDTEKMEVDQVAKGDLALATGMKIVSSQKWSQLPVGLGCKSLWTLRHLPNQSWTYALSVGNQAAATSDECNVAGNLQSCLPFPLHLSLAEDATCVPVGQSRMGVPEVWTLKILSVFYVLFCSP
uniref:Uncharacterized protein n=1 Tax=Ditylenchus dipsaci TaxID=166011 RepID=A0A915D7F2_9BILA